MLWLKTVIIGTFAYEHPVIDKVFRGLKTHEVAPVLSSDLRFHECSFSFTKFYLFFSIFIGWISILFIFDRVFPCFCFYNGSRLKVDFACICTFPINIVTLTEFCKTAHHLNNGSCLETARIRIWGLGTSFDPFSMLRLFGGRSVCEVTSFSSEKKQQHSFFSPNRISVCFYVSNNRFHFYYPHLQIPSAVTWSGKSQGPACFLKRDTHTHLNIIRKECKCICTMTNTRLSNRR